MSEYQFVHFLATDRPLDDQQLEFMRRQSTRATITRWEFSNEYHFGNFHGHTREMLQRGYDVHLHYANFGVRRLMIRLPAGLPCDRRTFKAFRVPDGLEWHPDKRGPAGILEIQPEADAGTYNEILYDIRGLLPKIAPVRELLLAGDLRPLYLGWLACGAEPESREPPVPAGLDSFTQPLAAMAEFYELSEDLLTAAAERSPPAPRAPDAGKSISRWIARQSRDDLRELVRRLLVDDAAATRAETLARIRDEAQRATWPLADATRTWGQLQESAGRIRNARLRQEQVAQEVARRKRLATVAKDPRKTIANIEKLVKVRSTANYEQAVRELVDLREALGDKRGPARARTVAERLRRDNPRFYRLIAALRAYGLLD